LQQRGVGADVEINFSFAGDPLRRVDAGPCSALARKKLVLLGVEIEATCH
jgi:hypothetical protein